MERKNEISFYFKIIFFLLLFILFTFKNEYKKYLIKNDLKAKIELLSDSKKKLLYLFIKINKKQRLTKSLKI